MYFMNKRFVVLATVVAFGLGWGKANAQGMAVNSTGFVANNSAMLDVSATDKGMLVPRMTMAQRNLISTPAAGLLIFQTDNTPGFYYYSGTVWTAISGSGAPSGAAGGDLAGTYPNPTLSVSGVTAGSYGSSSQVPAYTVDSKGRITAATNITITGTTPGGAAGGDLTGTYPNPTVANSSVTSAKILDGTITNSDISTSANIAYSKLNLNSSVATTDIATTGATSGQVLGYNGTNVAWTTPASGGGTPSGAAGGDLTGTYPNPTVASGSITNAKISTSAAIAYSKLNLTGSVAVSDHSATGTASSSTFLRGDNTWATPTASPSGAAGGDLSGTFPNPTLTVSGVSAGTYGDATHIPQIVVDSKGRITSATTVSASGGSGGSTATGIAPAGIPYSVITHLNAATGSPLYLQPTSSLTSATLTSNIAVWVPSDCRPTLTAMATGASGNFPLTINMVNVTISGTTPTTGTTIGSCVINSAGSSCSIDPGGTILGGNHIVLSANVPSAGIVISTAFSCY